MLATPSNNKKFNPLKKKTQFNVSRVFFAEYMKSWFINEIDKHKKNEWKIYLWENRVSLILDTSLRIYITDFSILHESSEKSSNGDVKIERK